MVRLDSPPHVDHSASPSLRGAGSGATKQPSPQPASTGFESQTRLLPRLTPPRNDGKGLLTTLMSEKSDWPYRRIVCFVSLAMALGIVSLAALVFGAVAIPVGQVVKVLLGGETSNPAWTTIVTDIRMPAVLTAILAGSALSVAGLQMQTLFRNPLADPVILGVSSGASLGVALVVLAVGASGATLVATSGPLSTLSVTLAAAIGAGAILVFVLAVSRRVGGGPTVLIVGLMTGYLTGAMVSVLIYFSNANSIRNYINWGLGSFSGVVWSQLVIIAPIVMCGLFVALATAKPLNAILLGENYASSMGANVGRVRAVTLTTAAILSGVITAFCGPIAFIGVAVPHVAKGLFKTSDHRTLMPASILIGAILAVVAYTIAQLPGNGAVLPINAITSLLGAPIVVAILLRQHRSRLGGVAS